ncbi:2-C-methyl-D-erythritol 4-phosphate cytidylyltransferase [Patescibacteria group bacterium]|nr:2-C-methyl-D-erythritol 4-phosphate cytidylyltransferase [Patescibacteria group bacterium]MBU4023275.1 2-C-methyl-D-erythritol 4-phosphate cytidylyltransferase [Patescibacteria group bacterium]
MNIVIILAAGQSRRVKGINKIFYLIKGKPLIFYTISIFEKHPKIKKIIIIIRKSDFKKFSNLIKKYRFKKIVALVEGNKTRQGSAFNGLKEAEKLGAKSGDIILFHNGCNPLVSKEEIFEIIRAAKKNKAAVLAQPARDTIKKADKKGFVEKTISRESIYLAQTPQVMEFDLAKRAFEKAFIDNFQGTDDVMLVERLGKKVKIVPTNSKNIKITYPEDLDFIKKSLKL